jgi:hypothetical protein
MRGVAFDFAQAERRLGQGSTAISGPPFALSEVRQTAGDYRSRSIAWASAT